MVTDENQKCEKCEDPPKPEDKLDATMKTILEGI